MSSTSMDIDIFAKLAKLPLEIITIILDYLPKCILPKLLYLSPIRKIVASAILLDVEITEHVKRHERSNEPGVGFSKCDCDHMTFQPECLKQGVNQWKIFPRIIHLKYFFAFKLTYKIFPEVLYKALKVNATFFGYDSFDPDSDLKHFAESKVKFDSLTLQSCEHVSELPTVVTSLELDETILDNYEIDGLKKLILDLFGYENTTTEYSFASSLEDLTILDFKITKITLPPNLRRLYISTFLKSVDFVSEEMPHLEYLLLSLPDVKSLEDTGIHAPNLKTLEINSR